MCSELLRIPIVWNGVPVFGFGVVLLIWVGVGGWIMFATARQTDWPTALKAHLPTLLIVAALIAVGVPRFIPGGVPLRSYGILMLTGIVVGIWLVIYRAVQAGLEVDDILGMAMWVIPCGAIGGRLFYVIQYWDERIRQPDAWATLKNALAFTEGGLVVYGAFAGAVAGFIVYTLRHKLPALATADIIAPSLMIGLSFGRIGCLMNGCCYGGESDAPWAITFPRENSPGSLSGPYAEQASEGRFFGFRLGAAPAAKPGDPGAVVVEQVDAGSAAADAGLQTSDVVTAINGSTTSDIEAAHFKIVEAILESRSLAISTPTGERTLAAIPPPPRSLPVHPAQVYSAIDAGLLGWLLWSFYPYRRRDGEVIALMLMLHPISRFLLEAIRVDEAPVWGTGLSISQNLSIGLFAIGAGLWFYLQRNPAGRLAFPLPAELGGEPKLAPVR